MGRALLAPFSIRFQYTRGKKIYTGGREKFAEFKELKSYSCIVSTTSAKPGNGIRPLEDGNSLLRICRRESFLTIQFDSPDISSPPWLETHAVGRGLLSDDQKTVWLIGDPSTLAA
jgi:hypothetical protein